MIGRVPFLSSFYVRLSLIFLTLILLLAVLQAQIAANAFERKRAEIDQRANTMLAADMASEIEPYLSPLGQSMGVYSDALGSAIHYMMVLNPLIEIYLVSAEGTILGYFADTPEEVQLERINLDPVFAFLSNDRMLPIYGDDPRRPNQPTTFSAARLSGIGNGSGFLYVVLKSSVYDTARTEIEDQYFQNAFRESLFLSIPLVAILGLLLFFLLTLRLRRLTATVRAFGTGQYDVRVTTRSRDEVGELSDSFNLMADQIASSVQSLAKVERERRDLVANISHDLRTPLSTIRGYIETVLQKDEVLSPSERREYLRTSLSSAEALGRLVGELFELSRLENADSALRPESFSLAELGHDLVMQFSLEAKKRDVSIVLEPPADLFVVRADISLIERTITNLLENALRYTFPGTTVQVVLVEVSIDRPMVQVSITDQGPGLTKEQQANVFQRYYTEGTKRGSVRTGLGLAIAQRIVELHGGKIGARSEQSGGSEFYFTLPLEEK
ncbi:MAG: HAMP domain-containing histidine kinase [Spirochaetales bacterium]|nr:HAMP domain-containing histidine kinase [Spirochaetales bacterium]